LIEAVRPATADDIAVLAELAAAAIDELRPTKGGSVFTRREAREPPFDASLRADIDAADVLVLVGTIDDAVVGYAVAHVESLHDGSRLGVITDLFVETEARAVGVGELLADEIVRWAVARDCVGIDSIVLPGNRETKNFFETFRFTARAIVVHRRLEGRDDA
jgi:ribosomal protein S18 acetylase RimI-like enzyme